MSAILTSAMLAWRGPHCFDADLHAAPTMNPNDPRNDQDDIEASVPTVEQLAEDVADEQLRTPDLVAWTISKLCTDTTDAVKVDGITDMAAQSFDTLLAIVGGGTNDQVLPAGVALRGRIKAHHADIAMDEAKRRHAEMLPTLEKAHEDAQRARFAV